MAHFTPETVAEIHRLQAEGMRGKDKFFLTCLPEKELTAAIDALNYAGKVERDEVRRERFQYVAGVLSDMLVRGHNQ